MVTTVSVRDEGTAHRERTGGSGSARRRSVTTAWQKDVATTTDTVELDVPADPAYLAVVRTATAGLAARLDLTLDEIEDLRIAVDEACSLLLDGRAHPGSALRTSFTIGSGILDVVITGPAAVPPKESSFAWSVLHALVGGVETGTGVAGSWIRLTHVGGRSTQ
jgi:serine/threonine-protein kinase RsbW